MYREKSSWKFLSRCTSTIPDTPSIVSKSLISGSFFSTDDTFETDFGSKFGLLFGVSFGNLFIGWGHVGLLSISWSAAGWGTFAGVSDG